MQQYTPHLNSGIADTNLKCHCPPGPLRLHGCQNRVMNRNNLLHLGVYWIPTEQGCRYSSCNSAHASHGPVSKCGDHPTSILIALPCHLPSFLSSTHAVCAVHDLQLMKCVPYTTFSSCNVWISHQPGLCSAHTYHTRVHHQLTNLASLGYDIRQHGHRVRHCNEYAILGAEFSMWRCF